jgi:hypothetical protein
MQIAKVKIQILAPGFSDHFAFFNLHSAICIGGEINRGVVGNGYRFGSLHRLPSLCDGV